MQKDIKYAPRSFGFKIGPENQEIFLQGTVYSFNGGQDIAGFYGEKEYSNVQELARLANWPQEELKKVLDKVTKMVNS